MIFTNLRGEFGEEQRLFHCAIPSANHYYLWSMTRVQMERGTGTKVGGDKWAFDTSTRLTYETRPRWTRTVMAVTSG